MWLRIFFCCLLYLIVKLAVGQPYQRFGTRPETKNVIFGTFGTYAPVELYGTVSAMYERRLVKFGDPAAGTLWFKAGYGFWAAWLSGGDILITGITWLPGHGASHPEFSLGFSSLFDRQGYDNRVSQAAYLGGYIPPKSRFRENWPAVAIGYRYQKMDGHFIFRIGAAYPEGAYASLGCAF